MRSGSHKAGILLTLTCVAFYVSTLNAQTTSVLSAFTAVQDEGLIRLRWTFEAGQTCDGTLIERADSSLSFSAIGEIPGICGSITAPVSYTLVDSAPLFNRLNYYRLELGNLGFSDTLVVQHSPLIGKSHLLYPNPFQDVFWITFDNKGNEEAMITVLDLNGRVVFDSVTIEGRISLDARDWKEGSYIYRLIVGETVYTGLVSRVGN